MKNRKEVIIFTIVIIALLVITIGGIGFAYFASKTQFSDYFETNVLSGDNMYTFESNTDANDKIEFNINFNEMSEASANNSTPVKSDTANINVSLTNPEEGMMTTCTYDIVWVWDSEDKYIEADVDELPYTHLATGAVYNYEFSTKADEDAEQDLSEHELIDDNKVTLKSSASITAIGKQTKTINHEITSNIYNLPVDQPNLFNKNFKAHIEIENVDCKMKAAVTINTVCPEGGSLGECIKKLGDSKNIYVGDGELIKHTEDIETSAGDGGYRYSGNEPNNYICFGAGSERYNSGETDVCATTNKYRIIGFVPVVKADDTTDKLIKIIKAEYLTALELGRTKKDDTALSNKSYTKYARIEADPTNLDGFHWNDVRNSTWNETSLYNSLNDADSGYLKFLYGDKEENKSKWEDMIEDVKWNVGGWSEYKITPKAMYEGEMTDNGGQKTGSGTQVSAKIGLLYVNDYGYASSKDNWILTLYPGYNSDDNLQHNWLFNGVNEWTISYNSADGLSDGPYALIVGLYGRAGRSTVYNKEYGVRPVLYLKSDVSIAQDNTTDGSRNHPYKVA